VGATYTTPGGIPGATGTPTTGGAMHPASWIIKIVPIAARMNNFFIAVVLSK